jgi:superfamily II DNA or RNA helicase
VKKIRVTVDSYLRLEDEIPDEVRLALGGALNFSNPENEDEAIGMMGMDHEGRITFPRGFAVRLQKGMEHFGYEVEFIDNRSYVPWDDDQLQYKMGGTFELREYQNKAVGRMLHAQQGIYEAPTGSGKTISCAAFISEVQVKTIILVDKINLATQWKDRLRDALGIEAGIIGDGRWEEKDVTIAIRQTLWYRHATLDADDWWSRWGAVILDECHAISAETVRELIQRFPAYYRIGVSATPDRHDWLGHVSRSMIGEIVCRTSEDDLLRAGVLVRPQIIAVKTSFTFNWSTMENPQRKWQHLINELRDSHDRNREICEVMKANLGKAVLVHTEQVKHANVLEAYAYAAGWAEKDVFHFTGKQKDSERQAIMKRAAEGNILILSTIGKEALDIPRLDVVMIVWPTKNQAAVTQLIGRIMRVHDLKDIPVVFDFWDHLVGPLNNHFGARRGVYERRRLDLKVI